MNQQMLLLLLAISFSASGYAKEKSRPQSFGGKYILELNNGVVFEESENVHEVGLDFERFIEGAHHHLSFGVATEVEFKNHSSEYYFGPMISAYYFHFKAFLSSGILTNFNNENHWKTRLGLGYEIVWLKHWLVVPTLAIDYSGHRLDPVVAVGLACEF